MAYRSTLRAVVVATAVAVAAAATTVALAAAPDVFTVYVSPAGADGNDGLTEGTAVKTLGRVQAVLMAQRPRTDVEVRISQGVYAAAPLVSARSGPHTRRLPDSVPLTRGTPPTT
jgi:hypothetical protein